MYVIIASGNGENIADFTAGIIASTFVSLVLYCVLMATAASKGLGLHTWQYTEASHLQYYKWAGLASEFWLLGSMGFKMSLLFLYLKLASSSRELRWTIYVTMAYVLDWLVAGIVTGVLRCTPNDKEWEQKEIGWCIQSKPAGVVFGAGNISSDLIIGILAFLLIWRRKFVTTQQRVEIGLVISSGVL